MKISGFIRRFTIIMALFLTIPVFLAGKTAVAYDSTTISEDIVSTDGFELIIRDSGQPNKRYVPPPISPPPLAGTDAVQDTTFNIVYNPSSCEITTSPWPANARTAFQYASDIWGSLLDSAIPVTIHACWTSELPPGVLGSGGSYLYRGTPNLPIPNTWYAAPLANNFANNDLNGSDREIRVYFNSSIDWYYGTDGNTPITDLDFVSVVLHEITHGLGFGGSMRVDDGVYNGFTNTNECNGVVNTGCWGIAGYPTIYDRFTENGSGQSLLNTALFPNPSTALGNQLRSNNLFFDGAHVRQANGGARAALHAPATWTSGSSYSHLAETFNNSDNALMTYSIGSGEAIHHPGPVGIAVLLDLGWVGSADTVGIYAPDSSAFYLRNLNLGGAADITALYGPRSSGWTPLAGDWNGNGTDTIGLYAPAQGMFYLRNMNAGGYADISVRYGPTNANWIPVVGDWDGNGTDTIGLYSPSQGMFYLRNTNTGGYADISVRYGPTNANWIPVVGDWDGNGSDTVGLYVPDSGLFYLRNSNTGGIANISVRYGPQNSSWAPIMGDWDGNGTDTVGLYAPELGIYFLRNSNTGGVADLSVRYGPRPSSWTPLVGDWGSK
jgi:hypothetical protein